MLSKADEIRRVKKETPALKQVILFCLSKSVYGGSVARLCPGWFFRTPQERRLAKAGINGPVSRLELERA